MAHVTLSHQARRDLHAIHDYIQDELLNPDAAVNIMRALREHIESLANMPERGIPLDTVLSIHTDFRFLVCKNYRIFYLTDGATVEVVRILHSLQDYMRALFL